MDLIWGKSMEEKERAKKNMNYGGEIERENVDHFFGLEISIECYK